MSPSKVKEQFQLATNEETTEVELQEIWRVSKSVRVRKAVASNPNAGPSVLRDASRLYLEEVLNNPGFLILELFDEDPWISKLSLAYSAPWDFILAHGNSAFYSRSNREMWDHFGWAALLSSQLQPASMEKVLLFMTVGALRRALKNVDLLGKLAGLYDIAEKSEHPWPFSLETMIILHCEKVISTEQFFNGLSNFGPGSTSARKGMYVKHVQWIQQSYKNTKSFAEKEFLPRLLAKITLISRSHTMRWIVGEYSAHELNEWAGELYCDAMKHMLCYSESKSLLIHDNLDAVGSVVSGFIKRRFFDSNGYSAEKISDAYNFIKSKNLHGAKFKFGLVLTDRTWMDELDKCSGEVKEFFCRTGCLGSWASATGSDIKYKIFNNVNWGIYLREGIGNRNLLFNSCSTRKVISIESRTHIY